MQPFSFNNCASISKIIFFSESEVKRDWLGLDGIVVSRSILKVFMVVLGLFDDFTASENSSGVVVTSWSCCWL